MKRDKLKAFENVLRNELKSLEETKKCFAGIFESTDKPDILESFKVISNNLNDAVSKTREALMEVHYLLSIQREG